MLTLAKVSEPLYLAETDESGQEERCRVRETAVPPSRHADRHNCAVSGLGYYYYYAVFNLMELI